MRSGLYALIALDGAPLLPEDLETFGLTHHSPHPHHIGQGFAVAAVDREPDAVHVIQTANDVIAFAGYLDEPEDLAASLGLAADTAPAVLAAAALARFGNEVAARMLGGWSLLRWDVRAREVTLLISEKARDAMFFATDGKQLAVAPEMLRLCTLPWVGRTLDPKGFALSLCRASLLSVCKGTTPWKGVQQVMCGVRETISSAGRLSLNPREPEPPELWRGSFDDAVDALNVLCRKIVGQHMLRAGRSAFLLSGGIDSSLLSALGAEERGAKGEMFCLSSISPPDSGVPDEFAFSSAVAKQLGVEQHCVVPSPAAGPYRPSAAMFAHTETPLVGASHYLYELLWATARINGANAVFDGVGGEFTITHKPALGSNLWWLRRWRFQTLLWLQTRKAQGRWPDAGFHVKLAPQLLAALPLEWKDVWQNGAEKAAKRVSGKAVGVHPGTRKNDEALTFLPGGMRRALPYFDVRLLQLAGSFPTEFFTHQGQTRALARAMLRGRVPESVRTRRSTLPMSPDYRQRARRQAAEAKHRIPELREAKAGDWIDLKWLQATLDEISKGNAIAGVEMKAKLTSGAAEFLARL